MNIITELAKTGPGTLMGELLRRFWQPVAATAQLAPGWAIPIRILSEDLTLYRGESGSPHIVAARCALDGRPGIRSRGRRCPVGRGHLVGESPCGWRPSMLGRRQGYSRGV